MSPRGTSGRAAGSTWILIAWRLLPTVGSWPREAPTALSRCGTSRHRSRGVSAMSPKRVSRTTDASFFYLQPQMALLPMSTTPQSSVPSPEPPHPRRGWRTIATGIVGLVLASALLWWFGHPVWEAYRDDRQVSREAESSA